MKDSARIRSTTLLAELEELKDWRGWLYKIPVMEFPPSFKVRLWPPFSGALVRMEINGYSIYLDVDSTLGFYFDDDDETVPYWELYDGDETHRWEMGEWSSMFNFIKTLDQK